ncbi:hypothetical protein LPJ56_001089 [Coemansia sp. RSA 2599]|nr:hypothetical protein LPJ75_000651 [Coemansia sp. RSA 2598]KAJ1828474.1 hypothetical protein LPJ56_001089 [Coemansia sp. RSA 2599]
MDIGSESDEARLQELEHQAAEAAASDSADYYAALNVSRTASTEDIRDAYRRLSRIFHPDRHQSAEQRQWAQRQFQTTQRAYEVLTDPAKRAAYDALGEQGIPMAYTVGYKVQTARDLQAHFEREARRRRTEEIEQWVQSKSEITATVSCVNGLGSLSAEQLFMKHSFAALLDDQTTAFVSGNMFSQRGRGSGNIVGTVRRTLGPQSWVSLSAPALPPYSLTVESAHQLSNESFCSTHVSQGMHRPPAATVTFSRMLTDAVAGAITVRTGNQYMAIRPEHKASKKPSGVALSLSGKHGAHGEFYSEMSTGIKQSHVLAKYVHQIDRRLSVSGGATAVFSAHGLHDLSCNVGLRATISEWTRAGWRVELSPSSGILATISVHRLGHKLRLPLVLTPNLDLRVALLATLGPIAAVLAVDTAVLAPRRRRVVRERLAELRDEQLAQLYLQKRHAEEAVRLMTPQAERSRRAARASGGLAIEKALYGDLPFKVAAENSNILTAALDIAAESNGALVAADEPRACDVTLALAALVVSDQLVVAGGASKRFLPGFYDPAFGAPKKLYVRYVFRGTTHEVVVGDEEALAIPMRQHLTE